MLLGALVGSLAGDVFLMLSPNLFISGLASFLVAHLFYIALFHQGQRWFPSKAALAAVLAVGTRACTPSWGQSGRPITQGAVALCNGHCADGVAGAGARHWVPQRPGALHWARIFMVSDSTIAINKFVMPVPWSEFWILSTYYAAQLPIVFHVAALDTRIAQAANANRN